MRLMEADRLHFRRKVLKLLGAEFQISDGDGEVVGLARQKALKLKEDIRVYADPEATEEVLIIQARQIVDFSAAYDVIDAASGQRYGALRRKGWASMVRDSWEILNHDDIPIGTILEDNMFWALVRRFLSDWVPQTYDIRAGEERAATIRQRFNPFVHKYDVEFTPESRERLPRPLAVAAIVVLMAIEGRQE